MTSRTGRISQKVAVSVVYVAAMFMTIMDATIVNVALPTIGRDFQVPSTSVAGVSVYGGDCASRAGGSPPRPGARRARPARTSA